MVRGAAHNNSLCSIKSHIRHEKVDDCIGNFNLCKVLEYLSTFGTHNLTTFHELNAIFLKLRLWIIGKNGVK